MVFDLDSGKKDDWKELLIPEAKDTLQNILDSTKKYRGAYLNADDVKIAQLWSALVGIRNDLDKVQRDVGKLEEPWKSIVEIGEAEKRKTVEKLVQDMIKPVDQESREATRKLVDSLMRF